ncbi:MAG TPA: hypothetical protein VHW23_03025 [Kofleriaceae bacterium]|nr:hypothetical protein [Kofleriaceae bacterium]
MALSARLGVALNLADCYERVGKTASAWVAFGEAAALARRLADQREAFALRRQDALVPRLSRLRILLPGAAVDGLTVTRDGVHVQPGAYGVGVPVDPGLHAVDVTAPGRNPWSTRVVVAGEGELATIEVPELEQTRAPPVAVPVAAPRAMVTRSPTPDALAVGPGRRRITPAVWASLGVAAGGFATGIAFGVAARSLWQQAGPDCEPSNVCSGTAYAAAQRSRRDANLSTASFAVGVAALAAGAILFARAPRDPAPAIRVVPDLGPRAAGATLVGAF